MHEIHSFIAFNEKNLNVNVSIQGGEPRGVTTNPYHQPGTSMEERNKLLRRRYCDEETNQANQASQASQANYLR
jgi:hypothetical protein